VDQIDEGLTNAATLTHFPAQHQFGLSEEWIVRWAFSDGIARESIFTTKAEALAHIHHLGFENEIRRRDETA